jgi:hypothetical protein
MPTSCRAPCLRTSNCCISSSDRCSLVRPELPSPNTTPRVISTGLQYAIDRRAADLEGLCDLRCPKPLCLHCAHLGGVYRGRPPLIDARSFGLGDAHGFFGFLGIRVSLFASAARPYQNKNPTSAIGLTAACATGLEGWCRSGYWSPYGYAYSWTYPNYAYYDGYGVGPYVGPFGGVHAQGRDADLKAARRQVDRAKTTAVAKDSGTAMPHAAKPAKGPVPIGVATAAARSKAKG